MSINMNPQEIKVFLAEQKVCRMATVDKSGMRSEERRVGKECRL